MTDYSELKRLAEAANAYAEEDWHTPERLFIAMEKADAEFVSGCSPFSVLALIAENERQAEDLGKTELRALKFIHQCSAHADLYRELRMERDQLKAENEAIRAALEVAALAMWNSEANMDSEAAAVEEALANAAMSRGEKSGG